MSLTNAQYDTIMRQYEQRRLLHAEVLKDRREEVSAAIPSYTKEDQTISSLSIAYFQSQGTKDAMSKDELHQRIDECIQRKFSLLTSAGFPADYLEPIYDCPDCRDTGFIDGTKCHCFVQAELDLLYYQKHLKPIFEKENFHTFSLDYYSKDIVDDLTHRTSFENAKEVLEYAKGFVNNFHTDGGNIYLYGNTGRGKTFLSNCIGKALIDQGYSVIYLTAFELTSIFEKKIHRSEDFSQSDFDHIFDVDLLVIDDLGTEQINSFTKSNLYDVINERLIHERSTIISSNLGIRDLRDLYTERIASRIGSHYKILRLFGNDIRAQKAVS